MTTVNGTKINQLLQSQPAGIVMQSSWLANLGYSISLQKHYKKSNWLTSVGNGAVVRTGAKVGYKGAIYSLQQHSNQTVHPGGRTAFGLLGKGHYLEMVTKQVTVFGGIGEKLPNWFTNHDWSVKINYHQTSLLPSEAGLIEIDVDQFTLLISAETRAMMECLHLAPEKQDLIECYEIMEGLTTLPPTEVQALLEQCRSVKVKRLFLYMAEKAEHKWFNYLKPEKIDLGIGKRSIGNGGVFIKKYGIAIPEELYKYV